jgi:hypothetical protein
MAEDAALMPPGRMGVCIFNALAEHPYGLRMQELIPIVYPDPDKEPEYAASAVSVAVYNANKWWKKQRSMLRIRGQGGPGSVYRIWIARA